MEIEEEAKEQSTALLVDSHPIMTQDRKIKSKDYVEFQRNRELFIQQVN